jgi:hypothetical protein
MSLNCSSFCIQEIRSTHSCPNSHQIVAQIKKKKKVQYTPLIKKIERTWVFPFLYVSFLISKFYKTKMFGRGKKIVFTINEFSFMGVSITNMYCTNKIYSYRHRFY